MKWASKRTNILYSRITPSSTAPLCFFSHRSTIESRSEKCRARGNWIVHLWCARAVKRQGRANQLLLRYCAGGGESGLGEHLVKKGDNDHLHLHTHHSHSSCIHLRAHKILQ